MQLHDLKTSGRTLFAPVCTDIHPRRKAEGVIVWTITLQWDIDAENIARIGWPDWIDDGDRTKIMKAVAKASTAPAVKIIEDPGCELDIDLHLLVGGQELAALEGATAKLKRQELAASEETCRLRAILLIETGRTSACDMCDLIDSDVIVTVRVNEGLFEGEESEASEETPKLLPPVPRNDGLTPEESLAKPPRKRGRKAEQLPDEPDAGVH